jgi:hypothetical protein
MPFQKESSAQPCIVKFNSSLEHMDLIEHELFDCQKDLKEIGREWLASEYGMKLQQVASQSMDQHLKVTNALLYEILIGSTDDIDKVMTERWQTSHKYKVPHSREDFKNKPLLLPWSF